MVAASSSGAGLRYGLVGHRTFDYLDGRDESGSGNHGIVSGGVIFTTGQIAKAGRFDGTNDYVHIASGATYSFLTGSFSVSAWFKNANALPTDNEIYTIVGKDGAAI